MDEGSDWIWLRHSVRLKLINELLVEAKVELGSASGLDLIL